MIEVPENGSIWVSIAGVVIALWAALRDRGKDSDRKLNEKIEPIWEEFNAFKSGVEDTFKNHVVYRRDFQDYKDQQDRTLVRIENAFRDDFRGLKEDFTELKGMIGKITELLMNRAHK